MMNGPELEIFKEWQKMPINEPINCAGCGDLIITSYHQNYVFIFNEPIETYLRLCEECFELIEKDNDTG